MGRRPWSSRLTVEQCLSLSVVEMHRTGVFAYRPGNHWSWRWNSGDAKTEVSLDFTVVEAPGRALGLRLVDDAADELRELGTEIQPYEDTIEGRLGKGALQTVFNTLSENQRETLRLFFFEGYTLSEIAVKLDQHPGRVKNHYYRGLDRLRRQIYGKKSSGGGRS